MKTKNILMAIAVMLLLGLAAFTYTAFAASEEPVWFSRFAVYGDTVYVPENYESFVYGMKQHEGLPNTLIDKQSYYMTEHMYITGYCFYRDKIYYCLYPEAGAGGEYTMYSCDLNGENNTFIAYVLDSFICNNTLYYTAYDGDYYNSKIVLYKANLSDLSSVEKLAESNYFSKLDFLDSFYENYIELCYFDGEWLYYTIGDDYYNNISYYKIDTNGDNSISVSGTLDEFVYNYYIYGDKSYYFDGSTLCERDRNGGNAVSMGSISPADADSARVLCVTDNYVYYEIQHKYIYAAERPKTNTDSGISVVLNGEALSFDQEPVIIDGRTMVPLRGIFEAMGYTVDWDQDSQTAAAVKGGDSITVQLNNSIISYTLNGKTSTYVCDTAPQAVNGRTLVPIRAIAECSGCDVNWNSDSKTVTITAY